MATSFRTRRIASNETVYDQADFFQGNGYDRVTGILINQITAKLFFNNLPQPVSILDGSNITDSLVAAGFVYWQEIGGAAGYYNVRWRPSAVGHWRLVLSYPTGTQSLVLDYDVEAEVDAGFSGGLKASFG